VVRAHRTSQTEPKDDTVNHTLEELEQQFRHALDDGEPERIEALAALIDSWPQPEQASVLAAALWYAEQGLKVFPIQPGSKTPYGGTRGCKDATSDVDTIRAWWERWPDSNVAIATGHLVDVIDVDGPEGVAAIAGQVEVLREQSIGMVSTPRPGGQHWYVRHVEGRANKAGILPHVEPRGTGGYVCAPPSSTEQGTYVWVWPLKVPQ